MLKLIFPLLGLYSCPLAMTDGAAKTIETSGQWMTEKRGGSDVARGTETLAVPQPDGTFRLYGYKWFSSATDSDMTLTLARIVAEDGTVGTIMLNKQ